MSQERFWNWKDDDVTFRMNWRDLVLIPYGLYSGFNPVLASGLSLELTHDITKVNKDLTPSNPMGVWKSKQGVIVTEDAPITVPITAADTTNPRIDLIVAQHEYVDVVGGAFAQYKVIEGTPSTTPVAPALDNEEAQIILGSLYIPANISNLNDTGVVYTKEPTPSFASNDKVMYLDRDQAVTAIKVFNAQRGVAVMTVLDTANHLIKIPEPSNFYVITDPTSSYNAIEEVVGLDTDLIGAGQLVSLFTTVELKLTASSTLLVRTDNTVTPNSVLIPANTLFSLMDVSDTFSAGKKWAFVNGSEKIDFSRLGDVELTLTGTGVLATNHVPYRIGGKWGNRHLPTWVESMNPKMKSTYESKGVEYLGSATIPIVALTGINGWNIGPLSGNHFILRANTGVTYNTLAISCLRDSFQIGTEINIIVNSSTGFEILPNATVPSGWLPIKRLGIPALNHPNQAPFTPTKGAYKLVRLSDYWLWVDNHNPYLPINLDFYPHWANTDYSFLKHHTSMTISGNSGAILYSRTIKSSPITVTRATSGTTVILTVNHGIYNSKHAYSVYIETAEGNVNNNVYVTKGSPTMSIHIPAMANATVNWSVGVLIIYN